jgi:hypothetical protein
MFIGDHLCCMRLIILYQLYNALAHKTTHTYLYVSARHFEFWDREFAWLGKGSLHGRVSDYLGCAMHHSPLVVAQVLFKKRHQVFFLLFPRLLAYSAEREAGEFRDSLW